MSLKKNKANTIRQKIEAGFATKKDLEWLTKYERNLKEKQNGR